MLPSRAQLEDSVISHAPDNAIGPLFVDIVRGPILPPRGTKERDWQLRIWDQADFNSMWQGARSGLVKKIAHIPYEISGPPEKVQYYQDMLGYAHFGMGYEYLVEMWGRDYLTQSYGGIFEISGPGDPDGPLLEDATSINHLDSGRCYVTGNTTYPILYYSLWDGKLHRMHATRIYQIVDDPIPDERYFGLGTSALERAIAINQREVRMNQYVDARLDDMPQPGLLALSGASRQQWDAWVVQYQRDVGSDALGPFGRTIVVASIDPTAGVKAESIPFAQTPDKFDLVAYKSLDIDEIALAIGIDRQEIWQLQGGNLGSGQQSIVIAEKSKGKTPGTMISALERFMNWAVLPDDCEFAIKVKDNAEQSTTATLNLQYAQTAASLVTAGFTKEEVARVLIEGSQTYKDAFTDDTGKLTLQSEDPGVPAVPAIAPVAPMDAQPTTGTGDTPLAVPAQQGSPAPRLADKKYNPNQSRAENGEWGSGGFSGGSSKPETSGGDSPSAEPKSDWERTVANMTPDQKRQLAQSLGVSLPGTPSSSPAAPKEPIGDTSNSTEQDIPTKKADRYSKQQVAKLTPEEKIGLKTYTSNEQYQTINSGLRTNGKLPKEAQATVTQLDKVLSKSSLPSNATLYRARRTMPNDWKVGTVISDKAYVSTSTGLKQAEEFAGAQREGPIMRIRAPKGTKGLFTSSVSDWPEESEFLLPRGQKFKITKIEKTGARTYVDMELVQ